MLRDVSGRKLGRRRIYSPRRTKKNGGPKAAVFELSIRRYRYRAITLRHAFRQSREGHDARAEQAMELGSVPVHHPARAGLVRQRSGEVDAEGRVVHFLEILEVSVFVPACSRSLRRGR